jgi:hypothetical protein
MGTILTMRFNKNQAAIIADESTWHLGVFYDYRRTNYGDSIYPLINNEAEDGKKKTAIYAGIGYPPFHAEVSSLAKKSFEKMMNDGNSSRLNMQKDIYKTFDKVHKRYVNDRLNFHYGVELDDLNSGNFKRDGKVYELKQPSVKKEARKAEKAAMKAAEEAKEAAKSYLDYSSFSRDGLIEQLEYEGFTNEQAVFGVDENGL